MTAINLHKFGILPEDESNHVFTFIWENPHKLLDIKSVESSEITYAGHRWTIVCMRKEERYVGIYLKWKYTDGQSASAVSCKAKYQIALAHRWDYADNKYFNSSQKFTTSQSLLGKSKFIALSELLDLGAGFLDETGKRVVLELALSKSSSRYERTIDTSPTARTKKNASGYYFDTTTFLLANHRWYLRVYPTKTNSNGLPAAYMYLASKTKGLSIEASFRLYVGEDTTELLTYNYGEGAKFDGFGKTLSQPIMNPNKITTISVGVEVTSVTVWKDLVLNVRQTQNIYSPQVYKDYGSYRIGGTAYGSLTPTEAFQDQESNFWKLDVAHDSKKLTLVLDKGVHHYQQNKTKLLCWSATILSRDPDRANDMDMRAEPVVGYFSNFIDERGYRMPFSIELSELEERDNPYTNGGSEIMVRVNLISLQTIPVGMRSIPRFDYQAKHLLRARRLLQEKTRNLEDMREMAASRASLSFMDTSRDDRLPSETSSTSGTLLPQNKLQSAYKSYDSLDALSTGDMITADEDFGKSFFSDMLRHIASSTQPLEESREGVFVTSRDLYHGTREDVSTESGITVSDESSLLTEARPSPVDMGRQKEIVGIIIKFLNQRLPMRITEILEFGSLGTGTTTRSRMDVDLVIFSPDIPSDGQGSWMPSMLHALSNFIQHGASNPDPFYPLPKCSYFTVTPYALQFTCGGVDLDIMMSHDWDTDDSGGYATLYKISCDQMIPKGRQWCALATSKLQKKFIAEQPNEVKEVIKVIKHWRNCVQWKKTSYRPNSYLLSLLVVKAREAVKTADMKTVLQRVGKYVMVPELSISWNTYYLPEKYHVEFEPPTPLVRDPANPGFNVAETLPYWGQFRTEMVYWLKSLGVSTNHNNNNNNSNNNYNESQC